MFNRRLFILMVILFLPTVAIMVRLVQLQIVRSADYQVQAEQMLLRPVRYYPCVRGEITDRTGKPLAYDTASWNISVHYGALAMDADALRDRYRKSVHDQRWHGIDEAMELAIEESWQLIASLTSIPREELDRRARAIVAEVARMKKHVSDRRGVDVVVTEERMCHPIVRGLDQEQQVTARLRLAPYYWIDVEASHTRRYLGGQAMGHILGRLGPVDVQAREEDPNREDDLARYWLTDYRGISGAEELGEQILRGRRGRIEEDVDGNAISPKVEPENGRPFRLTLDNDLQQTVYNQLAAAVEKSPFRTGGCAVLVHVPTREVLAMVDYPSLDADASSEMIDAAIKDAKRVPAVFRAVREYYPPGSLVKPAILTAALTEKVISPQSHFTCYGKLFSDFPGWACTGHHGSIGPVFAIQHSCNVYFFHVAQLMGVDRLTNWLSQFGFGRTTGMGLNAEKPGIMPRTQGNGPARNTGIGQGELAVTPVQAANMMATIATGKYQPLRLWLDDPSPPSDTHLEVPEQNWQLVREGMYEVVNEPGGTAFGEQRATLKDPDYVLLGKTGSAEVPRGRTIETLYVCHFPDGRVQEVIAASKEEVLARFPPDDQPKIAGWRSYHRYPPDLPEGERYTHAWFAGYLTPRDSRLQAVTEGAGSMAIAVVIEFSGHGGDVAAPVARSMLRAVLSRYCGRVYAASPEEE